MANRNSIRKKRVVKKGSIPGIPLILVGVGLIIISLVSFWLIAKSNENSSSARASAGNAPPSAVPVEVEFTAPQIQLTALDGRLVNLADYKGQVVLLNNWAIWCPPCKAEMPVLQAYYDKYKEQDFTIIAIEAGEAPEDVQAFVKQYQLTFPVWPDPEQQAMQAFQAFNLPNSYVIDRTGVVRLAWTGAISEAMLEKFVTPLLME